MKILHVSTGDSGGGAARAAYRIHRALFDNGIDSRMRVLQGGAVDPTIVSGHTKPALKRVFDKVYHRQLARTQRGWHTDNPILHTFGQTGAGLVDELNNTDADILHLHWVSGMLSIADIGRLTKPIVWTLHDMWAFCGGEHYVPDNAQARFRLGYRADNRTTSESGPDLNRRSWETKQRAWATQRFTIISPSQWLADCVCASALMRRHPVHVLPNPLDTNYPWRPVPQEVARTSLGLPLDSKLILMGADGGVRDPRKGGDLLRTALAQVIKQAQFDDIRLVIYGQHASTNSETWPCPVHWLGEVRDDRVLALAYSAADVMIVPSRQDNLPNTAVEAQVCGLPVVAFDVGGLPDIVVHRKTGWLARGFDVEGLAEGICWVLGDKERGVVLRKTSREVAVQRFDPRIFADKCSRIYEKITSEKRVC